MTLNDPACSTPTSWAPRLLAPPRARNGPNSIELTPIICDWQSGDKEQARKWHDRAVEWMDKNKVEDQELLGFRAEAAELLGVEAKKK